MNRRPRDVVALVVGTLCVSLAVAVGVDTLVAPLTWTVLSLAAPVVLVVVGVAGLALSRNPAVRTKTDTPPERHDR